MNFHEVSQVCLLCSLVRNFIDLLYRYADKKKKYIYIWLRCHFTLFLSVFICSEHKQRRSFNRISVSLSFD